MRLRIFNVLVPKSLETSKFLISKVSILSRLSWIVFFLLSGAFFCHICKQVHEKWDAEQISLALSGKSVNVEDVRGFMQTKRSEDLNYIFRFHFHRSLSLENSAWIWTWKITIYFTENKSWSGIWTFDTWGIKWQNTTLWGEWQWQEDFGKLHDFYFLSAA